MGQVVSDVIQSTIGGGIDAFGRNVYGSGNYRVYGSSGTFVVPQGVGKVRVRVIGGGGGLSNPGGAGGICGGGAGAGERVVVRSSTADCSVRVHGYEEQA